MNLWIATFRTLFFYFYVLILYRIMGKREVGELGIVDLIVSILIANIVAISIENLDHTILESIIPIFILMILEIGLAFISVKSRKVRYFLEGKPSVIIKDGKLVYKEMMRQRYNLDDLLMELRNNSIPSIEDVSYAVLESNGKLSIFKKDDIKNTYPLPLILDGEIIYDNLHNIKKSKRWFNNLLIMKNIKVKDVFYAYYHQNKVYFIMRKELL